MSTRSRDVMFAVTGELRDAVRVGVPGSMVSIFFIILFFVFFCVVFATRHV